MSELILPKEKEALDHLVNAINSMNEVNMSDNDMKEWIDKIHQLQDFILSRVGRRALGGEYTQP